MSFPPLLYVSEFASETQRLAWLCLSANHRVHAIARGGSPHGARPPGQVKQMLTCVQYLLADRSLPVGDNFKAQGPHPLGGKGTQPSNKLGTSQSHSHSSIGLYKGLFFFGGGGCQQPFPLHSNFFAGRRLDRPPPGGSLKERPVANAVRFAVDERVLSDEMTMIGLPKEAADRMQAFASGQGGGSPSILSSLVPGWALHP